MSAFEPPRRRLHGPGPSDVSERVLEASAKPTIGHLDPAFQDLMETIKGRLRGLLRTENAVCLPLSAPATAAMEASFANLVEDGDHVVVARNGVFGGRMSEMAERLGARVTVVDAPWGRAVDPDAVRDALDAAPDTTLFAFVHAETSTGARSDAETLCALAAERNVLTVVDCVTSFLGVPVETDRWGADVLYTGSQKCLSAPPGLAPITFSPRAADRIRTRRNKAKNWFLDLSLILSYWSGEGGRSYHHTAPVNALYGLNEALAAAEEEGLEALHARHRAAHDVLAQGLARLGLDFFVEPGARLPQLNAIAIPEGVDGEAVRRRMLDTDGVEIGAGLGPLTGKIWRIGLMGESARPENAVKLVDSLEAAMRVVA